MSDEHLYCYKWERNPEAHTGPAVDYWNHYPGAAEQYDTHEVTILFWDNPNKQTQPRTNARVIDPNE